MLALAALVFWHPVLANTTWRGLTVAPENRCSAYSSNDYRYSQSVEDKLVEEYGGVYSPYTGEWFATDTETDIEHMVARSEAHDSGMCARSADARRAFAGDLLNLTLSEPRLNRFTKSDKDAAQWLPQYNFCWFANRIVQVKNKYDLTVDRAEAEALEGVLRSCTSTALVIYQRGQSLPAPAAIPGPTSLPVAVDPGMDSPAGSEESYPWEGPLTDIWLGDDQAILLLHAPDGAAIAVPLYFDDRGAPDGWSAMSGHIEPDNFTPGGGELMSDPPLSNGRKASYKVHVENVRSLRLELLSCARQWGLNCAEAVGDTIHFTRLPP